MLTGLDAQLHIGRWRGGSGWRLCLCLCRHAAGQGEQSQQRARGPGGQE